MSPVSDLRAYFTRASTSAKTIDHPVTEEPAKSRFRLDNSCSDIFILPDGRQLGYAQYGSQTGPAVLYLHGIPGSRIEAAMFDELSIQLGIRIIAADRPGIGWSSPHPGRTLLDYPKDLEHLAKHLELDAYSVLGVSGGGPYALACAMSLPREKLKSVSIVCGLGPPDIGMKGAHLSNWFGFTLGYRYMPCVVKRYWKRQPEGRLKLTDEKRLKLLLQRVSGSEEKYYAKDLEVMKDEDLLRLFLRSAREGFAQGFEGLLQDGKLMSIDFGFRIEHIHPDLPVQLWYGMDDTFVPLNHGVQIAIRLDGRAHLRVEDETHSSLVVNWKEDILKSLIEAHKA
ncbi:hypothetical protein BP5796_04997 [Coleophoma crateriformis]|uniref:AB hydrolase-1 domain-containing protein n=1 Tax=Coleophoma crateriformis TaxID=565419 RepID=A0A3D8SB24_9HELO|nr:hypothetical protein BP5796_04997 [Coleophoma crateriformis]